MAVDNKNIVVLVGGVGGAKLAFGLSKIIKPDYLTVVVNVADDFRHYGLHISPDIDTIMYTLSGRVNPKNGWGLADDTFDVLENIRQLGVEPWFRLGDKDLATHLIRSDMLYNGKRLTEIIHFLSTKFGITHHILPVSDDKIATHVNTLEHGLLGFQDYFVRHQWQPTVTEIQYEGIEDARITPEVKHAINSADVILIGPSNPWLSISPILEVPGLRSMMVSRDIPRIAITPIIGGEAVKGPAAKIMRELNYEVSAGAVAQFYGDTINGFVNDIRNSDLIDTDNLKIFEIDTLMVDDTQKIELSRKIISWLEDWN